jgi:hypothetical protein
MAGDDEAGRGSAALDSRGEKSLRRQQLDVHIRLVPPPLWELKPNLTDPIQLRFAM